MMIGIIPAYAGNTEVPAPDLLVHGDHPRVCGEHQLFKDVLESISGSSPRMRGTLLSDRYGNSQDGIIPAYAGNTFILSFLGAFGRDHPRVCGEHVFAYRINGGATGSSPRMRGTH